MPSPEQALELGSAFLAGCERRVHRIRLALWQPSSALQRILRNRRSSRSLTQQTKKAAVNHHRRLLTDSSYRERPARENCLLS